MTAESLADALASHLTAQLPALLATLDAHAGTSGTWASLHVKPHQERGLTVFPAVEVVVRGDSVVGYDQTDEGEQLLRIQYAVLVKATVRGGSFDETDRARKRLTAAVRELLLSSATPGEADPSRVRSSYSAIAADRNARSLAAGTVEVLLTVLEPAVTPPSGSVPSSLPITTFVVGVHHIEEPTGGTP